MAVNVHPDGPPTWLAEALADVDPTVYPSAAPARDAIAAHHRLAPEQVLPTAGAAEAFTLVARAFTQWRFGVVHPQFTEPEAALLTAGHTVHRHLLCPEHGFRLDVDALIADARTHRLDAVIVGNPTNPTSILHPRTDLLRLRDAGLTVVVDEAFLDFTDSAAGLLGDDLTGIIVIRSATKMWSIPGIRAGWVAGDPRLITTLATHQPPWSVSAHAAVALATIASPRADDDACIRAASLASCRDHLAQTLTCIGMPPVAPASAPFLLVDTGIGHLDAPALAADGISVRRGDTFPGLGPAWIRVLGGPVHDNELLRRALSRAKGMNP